MKSSTPPPKHTFEQALLSLSTYSDFEDVPLAFLRRVIRIMESEGVQNEKGVNAIATAVRASREAVFQKLQKCQKPPTPLKPSTIRVRDLIKRPGSY